jgi:hypothetical protein
MLAHIGGVPLEEMALSLAPVAAAAATLAGLWIRRTLARPQSPRERAP